MRRAIRQGSRKRAGGCWLERDSRRDWLIGLCFIVHSLALGAEEIAGPTIVLRPHATVETQSVTLGQVAEITARAEDEAAALASVTLGSAPVPGARRCIGADYIRLRLRRYGFNPAAIALQGEGVVVERPAGGDIRGALASPELGPGRKAGQEGSEKAGAPVWLVRRGQLVEVEVRCGAVSVRTAAYAGGDGGLGDLVELRLAKTNVRLVGRVNGPGRVLLEISGRGMQEGEQ